MSKLAVILISCSSLVSFVSLCVALVALLSFRRVTALLRSHSTRSAVELSASLTALQSSFESLSTTVRRLSSRYGMADRRARDGTSRSDGQIPLDELKGSEWRQAARAKYIRPGKPSGVPDV